MGTRDLSDEQLAAEAAREGSDGPAFVAIVDRFQDRVWRVCYRLMGNAEDASDASQEVFVRLFLQRAQFEGRSKYSTWMHGIAIRTCLMMRRGRGRRKKHEEVAQQHGTERHERSQRDLAATAIDVEQMLEILEDEDRAMLIMKYAEGYNYEELSEMFERSVSGCKMRLSRARDRLKERFPEHSFGNDED
ncbi:MAG: RNA polymerase sigma factor [Planctomycetaceae bacterium]|nr:RNA polymerase sigma factor [Planctomycetales bacterium]MCB9927581.1 RNA polymerase sigma factor [Planctomycetaceae bacterium]